MLPRGLREDPADPRELAGEIPCRHVPPTSRSAGTDVTVSRASRHQRPDPTTDELADRVSRLPGQLGVWRAGQHALYHLLLGSSLARITDLAQARLAAGDLAVIEATEAWRHATSEPVKLNETSGGWIYPTGLLGLDGGAGLVDPHLGWQGRG